MTTLAEVTQLIAHTMMPVKDGVATGGSTTTLIDTALTKTLGLFNGGTIWVTQTSVTYSRLVSTYGSDNTVTFTPALTAAIIAGIPYTVAPNNFSKDLLEQAVRNVLRKIYVLKIDSTQTVTEGADVTLPAGVSNVRQVFVAGVRCYHWEEVVGKLKFDKTSYTGALEIRYAALPTTPMSDSAVIDSAVDIEWLHWASVAKLWRDYYRDHLKDNPVAIELFNEARQNEQVALNVMRTKDLMAPARDPHHGNW